MTDWIYIKFKASPELFAKLKVLRGKRRWWEFFRDEYSTKVPRVIDIEKEAKERMESWE